MWESKFSVAGARQHSALIGLNSTIRKTLEAFEVNWLQIILIYGLKGVPRKTGGKMELKVACFFKSYFPCWLNDLKYFYLKAGNSHSKKVFFCVEILIVAHKDHEV